MKNFKFSLSVDTIIKTCVVIALIIAAATKQQYSYYNFLRWLVMVTFIYFCYRVYSQKQFGLLIYFGIVAVLFNPFHKFWFQKQTWHIIDYLIAAFTTSTIIYDLIIYTKSKRKV